MLGDTEIKKLEFTQPLCNIEEDGTRIYGSEFAVKELELRGVSSGTLASKLCVHTLMRGCVNSYIELHRLSHRPPVCIDKLAGEMFTISDDALPWIADVLCESEEAKRKSKYKQVYEKYIEVADFFEKKGDKESVIHFHELGLKSVKLSSDKELEGIAHEQLGFAHERQEDFRAGVKCHETFLRLAEASRDPKLKSRANTNLVKAYTQMGKTLEGSGDYDEAKEFYEKAVHTAANNGDQDAEAEAYSMLGNITVLLGDLHKALEYQKRFLLVSKQLSSEEKEGRAVRECAALQERLQQHSEAILSLKRALEIAEEDEDVHGIAHACTQLGNLYTTLEDHTKAVHYHKEAYRVAQALGDARKVQEARINVGMAEGNLQWGVAGGNGYVGLINSDIESLLRWKGQGKLE